jgi:hypothetical protein
VSNLIADRRPRLLNGTHDRTRERIVRRLRITRLGAPYDAKRRHLIPRTVEQARIDGVADLDITVAVAVRAHVSRRSEPCAQVGLRVLHRDEHRRFRGPFRTTRVEHMRVRIDKARQHGCLAEIDHLRT